jgi:cysteine-rich repeat protein
LNTTLSTCDRKCGNGIREDREECDDKNNNGNDGCASDCTVEEGFICEQGVPVPVVLPDVCRCDPRMSLAEWTDFWGTIRIVFDSIISYNSANGGKSNLPMAFCQQILSPDTLSLLGSNYGCYLWLGSFSSELIIDVGKDATIGNKDNNYETYVNLIEGAMVV